MQPSWPWKSSSVGFCAWSMVPMAPSATTTLVRRASRNAADLVFPACADDEAVEAMMVPPGERLLLL
ncbi:hypothetical protein GCM10009838_64120 [Catenulispora subtropica]|uniref:Secreted protein n=1 Tax=Catenulispora subtropica TaxID=450798 RepID=A0ABP5E4V5_9ACTN